MAQQRGLEPPIPCGTPAFQAGRLPLSYCCEWAQAEGRTAPPRLIRKKEGKRCAAFSRLAAADGLEPSPSGSKPGALPIGLCRFICLGGASSPDGNSRTSPPARLIQKREETAPHSAAGSGGWNRTNLSRVRAGRPTDRRRRCMARAGRAQAGTHNLQARLVNVTRNLGYLLPRGIVAADFP